MTATGTLVLHTTQTVEVRNHEQFKRSFNGVHAPALFASDRTGSGAAG
jgi:hypothetical protein